MIHASKFHCIVERPHILRHQKASIQNSVAVGQCNSIINVPNYSTGHHILPAPNGILSKLCVFSFREPVRMNLLGMNLWISSCIQGFIYHVLLHAFHGFIYFIHIPVGWIASQLYVMAPTMAFLSFHLVKGTFLF